MFSTGMKSLFFFGLCLLECNCAIKSVDGRKQHRYKQSKEDFKARKDIEIVTAETFFAHKQVIENFVKVGTKYPEQNTLNFKEGRSVAATHSDNGFNFIVNGQKAPKKSHPYIVTVQTWYDNAWWHVCGGALIERNKVLTAAHCLRWWGHSATRGKTPYRCGLAWDDLSLGLYNPGSQTYKIKHVVRHQAYKYDGINASSTIQNNDLAIITLRESAILDDTVQVIDVAQRWHKFDNQVCSVMGWGDTEDGYPTLLRQTKQLVMSHSLCKQFWKIGNAKIHTEEMCTWDWPYDLSAPCSGDSGGPLVCGDKLAGLVSWGLTYCNGCFPSIMSKISAQKRWIDTNL